MWEYVYNRQGFSFGWYFTFVQGFVYLALIRLCGFTMDHVLNPWSSYGKLCAVLMASHGVTKGSLALFNYAAQLMFKSPKVLPVMAMGTFIPWLRQKYPALADSETSPDINVIGVFMDRGALIMDSILGNLQEVNFTMNPETTQMKKLFCSTTVGLLLSIPLMTFTGKLIKAWNSCYEDLEMKMEKQECCLHSLEDECEKEQSSPMSVMDVPYDQDEEEKYEEFFSHDFQQSLANTEWSKHQLLQCIRRFECIVGLEPSNLDHLFEAEQDANENDDEITMRDIELVKQVKENVEESESLMENPMDIIDSEVFQEHFTMDLEMKMEKQECCFHSLEDESEKEQSSPMSVMDASCDQDEEEKYEEFFSHDFQQLLANTEWSKRQLLQRIRRLECIVGLEPSDLDPLFKAEQDANENDNEITMRDIELVKQLKENVEESESLMENPMDIIDSEVFQEHFTMDLEMKMEKRECCFHSLEDESKKEQSGLMSLMCVPYDQDDWGKYKKFFSHDFQQSLANTERSKLQLLQHSRRFECIVGLEPSDLDPLFEAEQDANENDDEITMRDIELVKQFKENVEESESLMENSMDIIDSEVFQEHFTMDLEMKMEKRECCFHSLEDESEKEQSDLMSLMCVPYDQDDWEKYEEFFSHDFQQSLANTGKSKLQLLQHTRRFECIVGLEPSDLDPLFEVGQDANENDDEITMRDIELVKQFKENVEESESLMENPMDIIDSKVFQEHFTMVDSLALDDHGVSPTSQPYNAFEETMSQVINAHDQGESNQTIHTDNGRRTRPKINTIRGISTKNVLGGRKKFPPHAQKPPVFKAHGKDKEGQSSKDGDIAKRKRVWRP